MAVVQYTFTQTILYRPRHRGSSQDSSPPNQLNVWAWRLASAAMQITHSLFWKFTQCQMVVTGIPAHSIGPRDTSHRRGMSSRTERPAVSITDSTFCSSDDETQQLPPKWRDTGTVPYTERTVKHLSYLTLRRLMSYIYVAPILDVSRSHTTTQHSR